MIAGVDEAGRGCIAGNVVAAAVILAQGYQNKELKDSKLLTKKKRQMLAEEIKSTSAIYAIGEASVNEINRYNILQATFLAMHRAIDKLSALPSLLEVDGNCFKPYKQIPHRCIVRGDALLAHIAAASVLAKVYRDKRMIQLDKLYHTYGWIRNKGYGTKEHIDAIKKSGVTKLHRTGFKIKALS